MNNDREEILVVVHPGSALGSADMNLGGFDARAGRDALQWGFDHWEGGVVVIHGDFSDELPHYLRFQTALLGVLARARAAGLTSDEILGDDGGAVEHNQEAAITRWVSDHQIVPGAVTFRVTGAWYHPEDGSGCVGSVINRLRLLGHTAIVHDSVLEMEMDDENEVEYPPSWPANLDGALTQAKIQGFAGFGGECFAGAMAMAEALFPDQPVKFVGAFNRAFQASGRSVGHVCIELEGEDGPVYLDADGNPKAWEDIESWGMLDVTDPEHQETARALDIHWDEMAANQVVRVSLTVKELGAMCDKKDVARCREQWGVTPSPPTFCRRPRPN